MDYEKKYNEALKWMRELYPGLHGATKEDAEHYFPELREKPLTSFQQCLNLILQKVYYASIPGKIKDVNKFILNVVRTRTDELVELAKRHEYTDCQLRESKEEKIRKYLIDELKAAKSVGELKFIIPQPTREECIAYLEKQKESLHVQETCKENIDSFTSEDERIRKEIIDFLETIPASELKRIPRPINEWFAWLEKQNEYHIPWYDYQKSKEAGYTIVPNEEYEQLIKQKEQNPAWSEEDEKMVRFYEDDYDNNLGNMPMRDVIENRIKFKDWLIKRIKSLRPSWKPSEEQMEGLKFFLDFHRPQRNAGTTNWREYDAVESLYKKLKKL